MGAWLRNWRERHQHPVSFWLHMVGIPMVVASLVVGAIQLAMWRWDLWWRPAALFTGGYLLQWIGHLVEGNDVGEIILFKRWLGLPYVSVSKRYMADVARKPE